MKKLNRFAVLLGLVAGVGVVSFVPAALAQGVEQGSTSEVMDNVDISMEAPMPPPMPGMTPGSLEGAATMMADPDELISMMHPGGDLMMIRAGVHGAFTDDQLEKMYKVKTDFMDRAGVKMVELRSHERALHDLLTEPEFDKGKAQSLQSKINGLRDDLANLRLEQQMGLLNCLTADQHKELRRSYVKHMDFGMGGMHHGMHGGMHGMHGGPHGGPHGGGHWEGHEGGEHHEHHEHHEGALESDKT